MKNKALSKSLNFKDKRNSFIQTQIKNTQKITDVQSTQRLIYKETPFLFLNTQVSADRLYTRLFVLPGPLLFTHDLS